MQILFRTPKDLPEIYEKIVEIVNGFFKRKWLAAIISITLIIGILQPCLAETAVTNDDNAVNVNAYIKKASVAYQQGEEWLPVGEDTRIQHPFRPMPEVKVTDQFTANKTYIDSYLGVTVQEIPAASVKNENNVPYENGDGAGQGSLYLGNSTSDTKTIPEPEM